MKKLLLILTLFVCCGCSNNTEQQQGEKVIDISNSNMFEIIRIDNHQYIFYHNGYSSGICHYEDCDYCHGQKCIPQ